MSLIPEHRQAIHGRTWDRQWNAYAGTHYKRPPRADYWAGVALAIAIGVTLAFVVTG